LRIRSRDGVMTPQCGQRRDGQVCVRNPLETVRLEVGNSRLRRTTSIAKIGKIFERLDADERGGGCHGKPPRTITNSHTRRASTHSSTTAGMALRSSKAAKTCAFQTIAERGRSAIWHSHRTQNKLFTMRLPGAAIFNQQPFATGNSIAAANFGMGIF